MQDNNWESYSPGVLRRQGEDRWDAAPTNEPSGTVGEEDRAEGLGGSGSPAYLLLLDFMRQMHLDKSAGYGIASDPWSNFRGSLKWGVEPYLGCLIRMSDKYQRLQNLIANPDNDKVGEGVIDTAMDLAAYALIFVCLWKEYLLRNGINGTA